MFQTATQLLFALIVSALMFPAIAYGSVIDQDEDGLIDRFELIIGTDLKQRDSDRDAWTDAHEVFAGFDPSTAGKGNLTTSLHTRDTDADGLSDFLEANINSDWQNPDSDTDGFMDGEEILQGFSPLDPIPVHMGKRIEVDKDRQILSYFVGPHHINSFLVSTGLPHMPTPAGEFKVEKKLPVHLYAGPGYYLPNTKWNLLFKFNPSGNYYIHGTYWHNAFGRRKSHGCVNVSYKDMEFLYEWADIGTSVLVKGKKA